MARTLWEGSRQRRQQGRYGAPQDGAGPSNRSSATREGTGGPASEQKPPPASDAGAAAAERPKSCVHEVARNPNFAEHLEESIHGTIDSPQYTGPMAKHYPFTLDPFQVSSRTLNPSTLRLFPADAVTETNEMPSAAKTVTHKVAASLHMPLCCWCSSPPLPAGHGGGVLRAEGVRAGVGAHLGGEDSRGGVRHRHGVPGQAEGRLHLALEGACPHPHPLWCSLRQPLLPSCLPCRASGKQCNCLLQLLADCQVSGPAELSWFPLLWCTLRVPEPEVSRSPPGASCCGTLWQALSNQKYRELSEHFPDVGLMTGDVTISPNAACLVRRPC